MVTWPMMSGANLVILILVALVASILFIGFFLSSTGGTPPFRGLCIQAHEKGILKPPPFSDAKSQCAWLII
ncbi:MAG: hypothetical protein HY362_03765 [Candidatus Aenigmarchaeota archaeon]|nr:hypothetical protein [Candidatus Aenigmarchaeota archaeon]